MTLTAAAQRTLLETIETQRFGCELAGSSLYSDVLEAVAADVERGGPLVRLLEPVAAVSVTAPASPAPATSAPHP